MAEYQDDEISMNADELQLPPLRSESIGTNSSNVSGLTVSGMGFLSPPLSMKQRIQMRKSVAIFDDEAIQEGYASVPLIDLDMLPRGGISFETKAVGRIQVSVPY